MVVSDASNELEARQEGYDRRLSVALAVTTPPTVGVLLSGSRVRALSAFLAIGLLAGTSVTWLTSAIDRKRRPSRRRIRPSHARSGDVLGAELSRST
jgi:hypothetical protein